MESAAHATPLFFSTACPEHPGLPSDVRPHVCRTISQGASLSAFVPPPLMQVSPIHPLSGRGTVTPQNKSSCPTWVQMGVNSEERCVASNKDVDIPGNTGQDLGELCMGQSFYVQLGKCPVRPQEFISKAMEHLKRRIEARNVHTLSLTPLL